MFGGHSILGTVVLRREDPALLTGASQYVDDIDLPGAARVAFALSEQAHACIVSIDTTEAEASPGVLAVVTSATLGLADRLPAMPMLDQRMVRPFLARDTVRYVGEPIVAVVAETAAQAEDAAALVIIDYEPLPAVVDAVVALDDDAPVLHQAAGTNRVAHYEAGRAGAPIDDEGDVKITATFVNQRVAPAPIEPRVAAAWWDEEGRLVQLNSGQGVHPVRDQLAQIYGLRTEQVHVVSKDVGGSFGAKAFVLNEEAMLGALAQRVGRPVRWTPSRSADMVNLGHARAQVHRVTIAGRLDGTITGYRLDLVQDAGAYPFMGSMLPFMTQRMTSGVYRFRDAGSTADSVVTNTTPTGAYRGAGRPEATAAIERAVDLFAAEIGMDPAEVRRRNLIAADAFPYKTPAGTTYDSGDYVGALDRALAAAGYDELRAEQARRRAAGHTTLLGIGLCTYVEVTAMSGGSEYASVEVQPDGRVRALTGSSPYGQGHHTTWAMLIAERTGIAMDQIEVIHGDTDLVPSGSISGGSRSLQLAGSAMWDAANKVVDQARRAAAQQLEAAEEDVVLDLGTGRFHVAGTPSRGLSWADVVAASPDSSFVAVSDFAANGGTFPFGAHVSVVEVDAETGKVTIVRHVACDDAGRIINPTIVDGQVHGGVAQGIAQALLEAFTYDADGNPLTANFADYPVISAAELPLFERVAMETPTPLNPLGVKGIGESGTIGAGPAVLNAVIDAVSHLGVRHLDMPTTPERVWRAIQAVSA